MTRPRIPRIKPLLALRLRAFLMLLFVLWILATIIFAAVHLRRSTDQAEAEAGKLRLEITAISHENQLLEEQVESLLTAYDLQSVELSKTVEALGHTEADLTEALRDLTAARSSRGVQRSIAGVEQWRTLVAKYFRAEYVNDALSVMQGESGGNPLAKNPNSSASGLFQHLARYWDRRSASAGWAGADIFDPEANIAVAAWLSKGGSDWSHWSVKPN